MKLLVIGAGNMAKALFPPAKEEFKSWEMYFYTPSVVSAKTLATQMNQKFISDSNEWPKEFDGVFLAHKPQQLSSVRSLLHSNLTKKPKFILSILAGVTVDKIQDQLFKVPVLRMMPNTPCLIGKGIITHFCDNDFDLELKTFICNSFGKYSKLVNFLKEEDFDQVTPILGSGPGVIFEICMTFQRELKELGLSEELSKSLINELFLGSLELSRQSSDSFQTLRDNVTSKGGITERIIEVLREKKMDSILTEGFSEGRQRGKRL